MDDIDRQLLIHLQKDIPLLPKPFEAVGRKVGIDSADVILRMNRLAEEKVIREIAAIFDLDKINYQSTLVGMKLAEDKVDAAAAVICRHPGVPQCCKRRGEWNLWFLLALPLQESLEAHVARLEQFTGAQKTFSFNTLQVYKPFESGEDKKELTEREIQLVRLLQEEFPLTDEPFRKLARQAGVTEESLLREIQLFQKSGFLKRLTATTTFGEKSSENTLVMWQVPQEKIDAAGRGIAAFSEVQSCKAQMACEDLPYSLHAVIERVSQGLLDKIEQRIGLWPSQCFLKEKDYKKSRLKYFSEEVQEWRNHFMESQKVRTYESA